MLFFSNNIIGGEIIKVVLQDGVKDCGICSLLSIIRYYGGEVSKEYLREITNTTKDGVSFYMLIEAAKKIGFDAIGVNGKIDEFSSQAEHFCRNTSQRRCGIYIVRRCFWLYTGTY